MSLSGGTKQGQKYVLQWNDWKLDFQQVAFRHVLLGKDLDVKESLCRNDRNIPNSPFLREKIGLPPTEFR